MFRRGKFSDEGTAMVTGVLHWAVGFIGVAGFMTIVTRQAGCHNWIVWTFVLVALMATATSVLAALLLIVFERHGK